jgi:hypothetical protein
MHRNELDTFDWASKIVGLIVGLILVPYLLFSPLVTSTYSGTYLVVSRLPMHEAEVVPSESPYTIRIASDEPFTTTVDSQVITGTLVPATFPVSYDNIFASKPITLTTTAIIGGTTVTVRDKIIRLQVQSNTPVRVTVRPVEISRNRGWAIGIAYAIVVAFMFYLRYRKGHQFRGR